MAQYLDKTGLTTLWTKIKEQDCKPLYNLGAYDTISGNVITRQTGYVDLGSLSWSEVDTNCWKSVVSNFPNIYTSGKVIVGEKYKSASITDYAGFIALGVGYIGMLSTYEYIICMSNGKPTGLAQYKLATPYTEEIIEGQPLITLDQQGSQWLRDEWNKSINFMAGGLDTFSYSSSGFVLNKVPLYSLNLKKGKTYTLFIELTSVTTVGQTEFQIYDKDTVVNRIDELFSTDHKTQIIRFTVQEETDVMYWYVNGAAEGHIMLTEGSIAYPYQAYNGEIVHDKDIADLYKQEYNLGYYDTMVENSDGTYTITRQTGYLVLDGIKNKFGYKMGSTINAEYAYEGAKPYVYKPTNIDIKPDIISNNFETMSANALYSANVRGISLDSSGTILVGFTTSVSTLEDANSYLVQNPISIQYKLATATTEKVEKNHCARYNQRFILEHNRNEAEISSNLFDINTVTIGNGYDYTATASDWVKAIDIPVEPNTTYTASYPIARYAFNHGNIVADYNKNTITTSNDTTTLSLFMYVGDYSGTVNAWFSNYMLNEGSVALSYKPYNSKAHITNYEADYLKTESDRSANLFDDNGTNSIQYIGHLYTNDTSSNYVLSAHDNYNCFRIRVEQNKTYYIKEINGLILRFEDINNNLVGGLSLFNIGYGSFTTPNGCKYVVFSKSHSVTTNVMLNEGAEPLPYQPYEGKVVHEKDLGDKLNSYVDVSSTQVITGEKRFSFIGVDLIKSTSTGEALFTQNATTGDVSLGAVGRSLHFVGNQDRPLYSKDGGVSYRNLALLADIPTFKTINGNSIVGSGDLSISGTIPIYGVSQLYRHDIEFDILNGDGIKCTFWSTFNEKIKDFSQIPYLAFSNIQVKNITSEKILNVVQWNSDGFRFYESDGTTTLIGDGYDGVTAYYINGEPQL